MKKYLRVTMPDLSTWDVPAQIIAENRARYYAKRASGEESGAEYEKVHEAELACGLHDDDEILDWAANNMNWSDVEAYAVRLELPAVKVDYQEGWVNGERQIVTK